MELPKKLIEVAMPIKEISAESVRDKSIRHGHISTLHLWWARRPLPVCRAVVFASLVPDPLDENCPQAFKDAVELLLGKNAGQIDHYAPYKDIPWTPVYDPMEDNLRNRLQMFIGKFSEPMQEHLLKHKPKPGAKDQLSDASLIKWDNKNNETIINIARKLIWVAHNSSVLTKEVPPKQSAIEWLSEFDTYYGNIKNAEEKLYSIPDRHIATEKIKKAEKDLHEAIEAFLDRMPRVFDPFAGGGAIPLEAARLGCRSFGNDINPVAHIIQKGSLEFPQKFGKPITYSKAEFIKRYGKEEWEKAAKENLRYAKGEAVGVNLPNRLSFDVEFYAKKLLAEAEKEIGQYYPADEKGNKPIAYYWARVGTCSNPSCRAEVPLLKGFYLANTKTKQVHLKPVIKGKHIDFIIEEGKYDEEGWMARGNLSCPVCGNTTDVKTLKQQFINGTTSERLLAVIAEGQNGKEYRQPTKEEIDVINKIPNNIARPNEPMPVQYTQALPSCTWGLGTWGQMFSPRQLLALQTLVQKLQEIKQSLPVQNDEYAKAIVTYLGILMDRIAVANTSFGVWHTGRETLERPMGRQAIPMVFDFPESNPFCSASGSALNQLDWLTRYIESENEYPFRVTLKNASSGEKNQFEEKLNNLQNILILTAFYGNEEAKESTFKIFPRLFSEINNSKILWASVRWYSILWLSYSAGITLLIKKDYKTLLRLLSIYIPFDEEEQNFNSLLVTHSRIISKIAQEEWMKKIQGHERYYAPLSEYLLKRLQPSIDDSLFIGNEYQYYFDLFEVLLSMEFAFQNSKTDSYFWAPTGRFIYKYLGRSYSNNPYSNLVKIINSQKTDSEILKAGFFNSDFEKFNTLNDKYLNYIKKFTWY
jgi:adenine-specific DNA methylase